MVGDGDDEPADEANDATEYRMAYLLLYIDWNFSDTPRQHIVDTDPWS